MNKFMIMDFPQLKQYLDELNFRQLHIHHTWKPAHSAFDGKNHIKLQRSMRDFHVESNGWNDIGQHLTLMPDGKWVSGRSFNEDPASIKGWNKNALAVELLGNFDIAGTGLYNSMGYDKLEGEQYIEILKLMDYFAERFSYDNIVFHKEGPGVKKTCPGTSLNKGVMIQAAKQLSQAKDISLWARDAFQWAVKNKLLNQINPKENINLERMLTILYRFSQMDL